MLAGAGLGAAEELRDAGWVCTGTQPFMARTTGEAVEDASVRLLRTDDLAEAQALAGSAFGVPEEVGAIVYSERALARPDTRAWGLYDDGVLRCCSLTVWVQGQFNVGWALATAPQHQRAGFGRRLLRASNFYRLHHGGPPVALCTASPAGERLYLEEGYTTLEHWQAWSRARWVLR
jgi:GNAT superfamily N-acetyltransferase